MAIALVIALHDPFRALLLTALVMPLGVLPEMLGAPSGLGVGLVDGMAMITILGWFAALMARVRQDVWLSAWCWPVVLLLAVVVLATTGAQDLGPAVKEWLRWFELLGIFLVTADLARTERHRRLLVGALFLAGIVQALVGIVQFFLQIGPPSFRVGPFLRAYGTFGQPNPYAGYLESVLPLALALVLLCSHERNGRFWRLAAAFAVLAGAALLMSFSRGGWLGFGTGVVVGAILLGRFKGVLGFATIGTVFVGLLATLGLLPALVADRVNSIVGTFGWFDARFVVPTAANWAVVERMAHWQVAVEMFLDHPFLGVGPGHYSVRYLEYAILPYWRDSLGHAHNIYLNVAAELGLLGLVAYLIMVGSWLLLSTSTVRAIRRRQGDRFSLALAVGVGAVIAALAVHNVFDNLYVNGMNVQVALLLGLVASLRRTEPMRTAGNAG